MATIYKGEREGTDIEGKGVGFKERGIRKEIDIVSKIVLGYSRNGIQDKGND